MVENVHSILLSLIYMLQYLIFKCFLSSPSLIYFPRLIFMFSSTFFLLDEFSGAVPKLCFSSFHFLFFSLSILQFLPEHPSYLVTFRDVASVLLQGGVGLSPR